MPVLFGRQHEVEHCEPPVAAFPCDVGIGFHPRVLFLPGAGGSSNFWEPVASLLPSDWISVRLSWPGLGDEPHDPSVTGIDDLVQIAERQIDGQTDVVAQSMGGVIAARLAMRRPDAVRRLVLAP